MSLENTCTEPIRHVEMGADLVGRPRFWTRTYVCDRHGSPAATFAEVKFLEWSRTGTARNYDGNRIRVEVEFKEVIRSPVDSTAQRYENLQEAAWRDVGERMLILDPANWKNDVRVRILKVCDSGRAEILHDEVPTQSIDIADLERAHGCLAAIPIEQIWERIQPPPFYLPIQLFELPPRKARRQDGKPSRRR